MGAVGPRRRGSSAIRHRALTRVCAVAVSATAGRAARGDDLLPVRLAKAPEPRAVALPDRPACWAGEQRRAAGEVLDLDGCAVVRTLGECHTRVFDRNGSRIKPPTIAGLRGSAHDFGAVGWRLRPSRTSSRPRPRKAEGANPVTRRLRLRVRLRRARSRSRVLWRCSSTR
jgi:hypothetical protein